MHSRNCGFAPVGPVALLEELYNNGILGQYHLLLTHDILDKKVHYKELFSQYQYATIIIDNSVIELNEPVDFKDTLEAAYLFWQVGLKNVIVVLPDLLLDGPGTVEIANEALKQNIDTIRDYRSFMKVMFVPQGRNHEELIQCAEDFGAPEIVCHIGVARNITHAIGTRQVALQVFKMLYPRRRFHLLGFSNNLVDDFICALDPDVCGIDSAVPLRMKGVISLGSPDPGPRGDWWETAKEVTPTMVENLRRVRSWLGYTV